MKSVKELAKYIDKVGVPADAWFVDCDGEELCVVFPLDSIGRSDESFVRGVQRLHTRRTPELGLISGAKAFRVCSIGGDLALVGGVAGLDLLLILLKKHSTRLYEVSDYRVVVASKANPGFKEVTREIFTSLLDH